MKAMIFAAGLGTRLKPLTDNIPKALVPVCGVPLIGHVCRRLRSSGIYEAVVNVHHFADKVEDWARRQDILSLEISDERDCLLETGGAVLHARPFLEGCGSFLIHNVDIISDLDIRWFASQVRPDALATLLVSRRKSSRQLLFEPRTMRLAGWRNLTTGELRSPYPDLNPDECISMAFSGIHILSDSCFDTMERYAMTGNLLQDGLPARFPIMDFYLWACACHNVYGVAADNLTIMDVGKSDTLEQAERMLSESVNDR